MLEYRPIPGGGTKRLTHATGQKASATQTSKGIGLTQDIDRSSHFHRSSKGDNTSAGLCRAEGSAPAGSHTEVQGPPY